VEDLSNGYTNGDFNREQQGQDDPWLHPYLERGKKPNLSTPEHLKDKLRYLVKQKCYMFFIINISSLASIGGLEMSIRKISTSFEKGASCKINSIGIITIRTQTCDGIHV